MKSLLTAIAVAMLTGCASQQPPITPSAFDSASHLDPARAIDVSGYHLPPLDSAIDLNVKLHIWTGPSFQRAALENQGSMFLRGFVNRVGAMNQCEIWIDTEEVRASKWTELGALLNHELDHCEGVTHAQMH